MRSAIDSAGRVVIPKALRERAGLAGPKAVEIVERDGRIEIEALPTRMSLRKRRGAVVAVPDRELPPLTDDVVREAIERSRR